MVTSVFAELFDESCFNLVRVIAQDFFCPL